MLALEVLEDRTLLATAEPSMEPEEETTTIFGRLNTEAIPILLDRDGVGLVAGRIGETDGADVFRYDVPEPGRVAIRQISAGTGLFDGVLIVEDESGRVIASESGEGSILIGVEAPSTYIVKIKGQGSLGDYLLGVGPADDAASSSARTRFVLDAVGNSASILGMLSGSSGFKDFRLTVPTDRPILVDLVPDGSSEFEGALLAFDGAGSLLDATGRATDSSGVDLRPSPSNEDADALTLRVVDLGGKGGAFRLTIRYPSLDVSRSFDEPTTIPQTAPGRGGRLGEIGGEIVAPGDINVFSVTAPKDGTLEVRLAKENGSTLDGTLEVYDAAGVLLGRDDASDPDQDSLIRFEVRSGATYKLKAGGYGSSTGAFILTLDESRSKGVVPPVTDPVELIASKTSPLSGPIDLEPVVKHFRIEPTEAGRVVLRISSMTTPATLSVRVYDDERVQIASNDARTGDVAFVVTGARAYDIRITSTSGDSPSQTTEGAESVPRSYSVDVEWTPNSEDSTTSNPPTIPQPAVEAAYLALTTAVTREIPGFLGESGTDLAIRESATSRITTSLITAILGRLILPSVSTGTSTGQLSSDYLLVWTYNTRPLVTTPDGLQVGFDLDLTTILEVVGATAYRPGNDTLQLLVIPIAPLTTGDVIVRELYRLTLRDVGDDLALAGSAFVLNDGKTLRPLKSLLGQFKPNRAGATSGSEDTQPDQEAAVLTKAGLDLNLEYDRPDVRNRVNPGPPPGPIPVGFEPSDAVEMIVLPPSSARVERTVARTPVAQGSIIASSTLTSAETSTPDVPRSGADEGLLEDIRFDEGELLALIFDQALESLDQEADVPDASSQHLIDGMLQHSLGTPRGRTPPIPDRDPATTIQPDRGPLLDDGMPNVPFQLIEGRAVDPEAEAAGSDSGLIFVAAWIGFGKIWRSSSSSAVHAVRVRSARPIQPSRKPSSD